MTSDSKQIRETRRLFDGRRLRVARELRGFSQAELGRRAGRISGTAISQFEKGAAKPTARRLLDISTALEFPVAFFGRGAGGAHLDRHAFFRSLRSTSARQRRQARAFAELVHEFVLALERWARFPDYDIPNLPVGPGVAREILEGHAAHVRRDWEIPSETPIQNMVAELERRGAVAVRAAFETRKLDAFSVPYEDRPVLVLGSDKGKRDRSRFDSAHELGHLVMHPPQESPTPEMEKQADQFAAGFLLPAETIIEVLPSTPDWEVLLALKNQWGTSIASLIYRAHTLGKMSDQEYARAMRRMSVLGWRVDEPGDLGAPESPRVLRTAVELLEERGLSVTEITQEAAIPRDQVDRILEASAPTRPRIVV